MKTLKQLPLLFIAALAISCSSDDDTTTPLPASQDSILEYKNGEFITGTTTSGGTAAVDGNSWSEMESTDGNVGYGANKLLNQILADDFTVPANEVWKINGLDFFVYQTNFVGAAGPVGNLAFEIYTSNPSVVGAKKIFGDLTTNRMTGSAGTQTYRIINNTPNLARRIFKITAGIQELTLKPGTYWVVWRSLAQDSQAHFYVPNKKGTESTDIGNNAIQSVDNVWKNVVDGEKKQDFPFVLNGTKTTFN